MNKQVLMPPELRLSVQYATPTPELPRWRIRRWVQRALAVAALDLSATAKSQILVTELTLRLVDASEARELNNAYRGRDYPTNVLTFEYGTDPTGTTRGDVVICVPVLHDEARKQKKPLLHHAAHLIVHGVLHALGYDHIEIEDANHMERLETDVLATFGIHDPYQV